MEKTRTLAAAMWLASIGLVIAAVALSVTPPAETRESVVSGMVLLLLVVLFPTVGWVIVSRASGNRIGWIYLTSGLLGGSYVFLLIFAQVGKLMGWHGWPLLGALSNIPYFPWIFSMVVFPVLLFPGGVLPSPRWRWVSWSAMLFLLFWTALGPLMSPAYGPELADITVVSEARVNVEGDTLILQTPELGTVDSVVSTTEYARTPGGDWYFTTEAGGSFVSESDPTVFVLGGGIRNPLDLGVFEAIRDIIDPITPSLLLISMIGSIAALIVRFRRSGGIERLQLKWLAYTASIAGLGLMATYGLEKFSGTWWLDALTAIGLLGALMIPVTTGMAIVRYRLYDIDRLISRTVVYGLLVGLLAGVYVGVVFLSGQLLPDGDSLSVAISTLAVAALFNPLRRRIKEFIDRRLYRERYDAQEVADHFTDRLQHDLDLELIHRDLLGIVEEVVKPEAAGLWVKDLEP